MCPMAAAHSVMSSLLSRTGEKRGWNCDQIPASTSASCVNISAHRTRSRLIHHITLQHCYKQGLSKANCGARKQPVAGLCQAIIAKRLVTATPYRQPDGNEISRETSLPCNVRQLVHVMPTCLAFASSPSPGRPLAARSKRLKTMRPALVCSTLVTLATTFSLTCSRPPSMTTIVPSSR